MALDVAEADRMIAAAQRAGVQLAPNHNYLFKLVDPARTGAGGVGGDRRGRWCQRLLRRFGRRSSYGASAGRSHWAWALPGGVFTNFLPHLAYLQLEFLGAGARAMGAAYGGITTRPS